MDYYSGAPEPNDYNLDNGGSYNGSGSNLNNFFKNKSTIILVCLAIAIVILFILFLFTGSGSAKDYNTLNRDSTLSELKVIGGKLEPSFSSDVIKYNIIADSSSVSFECKASSNKAKVEGCDESISVGNEEISYNIKVTAEDGNITRYYFKIVK